MELLAIEPLSDDMLSAIAKKMEELSPISFPGKKNSLWHSLSQRHGNNFRNRSQTF